MTDIKANKSGKEIFESLRNDNGNFFISIGCII